MPTGLHVFSTLKIEPLLFPQYVQLNMLYYFKMLHVCGKNTGSILGC